MNQAPVFDLAAVKERVDGDMELLSELLNIFFDDYPNSINRLEDAVGTKDPLKVQHAAHAIKSACGNLGAMRCHNLAFQLEQKGRAQALDCIESLLGDFKTAIEEFRSASAALKK
jgi:two-component system sensor histidine kinase/response regulator